MIEIDQLTFSYGDNSIFQNFSLLMKSNIFGVIGPNGAGKSTMLKLVTGLIAQQSGRLLINDMTIHNDRYRFLKKIGVLFENPQFPSWWKIQDHLIWVAMLRGMSRKEAHSKTASLLEEFKLRDRKHDLVAELSAGLRQRFGILQAIIGFPEVIFLDEPTSNLDVKTRRFVLEFLKNLVNKNNTQIVIFSHILSDLEDFCEEIAILNQGKLVFQEMVTQIMIDHQINWYVIKFNKNDDIEGYLQKFRDKEIEVTKIYNLEIIVKIDDVDQLSIIKSICHNNNSMIKPKYGILEELFLDLTE